MLDLNRLWKSLTEILPALDGKLKASTLDNPKNIQEQLEEIGIVDTVNEILWKEISYILRSQVVPKFWSHFAVESPDVVSSEDCVPLKNTQQQFELFEVFVSAIYDLYNNFKNLSEVLFNLRLLQQNDPSINNDIEYEKEIGKLKKLIRESSLTQLPANTNSFVKAFYNVSFCIYFNLYKNMDTSFDGDPTTSFSEVICIGCSVKVAECRCKYLTTIINQINEKLLHMELLDSIAGQTITTVVQKRIKDHISETCQGIFDKSHLKELEKWLNDVVITWLSCIFNNGSTEMGNNDSSQKVIQGFKVKLTYFLYENFAQSVIDQFFSIIIDFPDSIPAIDDLKICLEKMDMRKHLIKSLTTSLEARILHPGVNTIDILTGYVASIKAIRHLDSSGVILENVTAPIKEYLRKRSDTVRRVVTGLTEEGPTDLSEELAKGETINDKNSSAHKEELSNWENWVPDPSGLDHIARTQNASTNRSADIISMVVDIYGSKELFMNEYRNLMADRLLTQLDFNPEKEIRNLELLKLRFGESLLHSCEVMLKDVADSKRINAHIQSDAKYAENKRFDISSLIISAQFWPSFNKESLELPEEIAEEFTKYTKSYEAYKGNRTLNWRSVTGRVNIVVEMGERTIEMTVPPTQAVILYHFQHKNEWTLDELSNLTKVPQTVLRRRIGFWQVHNLICEPRPGVFKLIEEEVQQSQFNTLNKNTSYVSYEDDVESAMASASDQREEELQVFWSYIVGMLTNLDSLSLERIHQMLKLFASHGVGTEFSQDELRDFLQRKVREHKLLYNGGVYQLAK